MVRVIFLAILLFQHALMAQVNSDTLPTRKPVLRINVLGIGLGVESPIFPALTLYIEGGLNLNTVPKPANFSGRQGEKIVTVPYVSLQGRYYYNLHRRKQKGKTIRNFSADFIGVSAPYIASTPYSQLLTGVGPVWGMQRSIGKRAFYGFHLGPAIYLEGDERRSASIKVNINTWLGVGYVF